ncbi:MAG: hypothetical protein ACJ798_08735 [Phenylobacterium sp.]
MTTRRDLIAGAGTAALIVGLGGTKAWGQAAAPPLIPLDFYLAPTTADTSLSPSGKRVAVLRNRYTEAGIVAWIDIVDTQNPTLPPKSV